MRSKPIIEDVLDKIRCPQFGYDDYGEWGALKFNQRLEIKELCNYAKILENDCEELNKKIEQFDKIQNQLEEYLLELTKDSEFRVYANMILSKLLDLKKENRYENTIN